MDFCIFCSENVFPNTAINLKNHDILLMIDEIDPNLKRLVNNTSNTSTVCSSCITLLQTTYDFKILCAATESKLENFVTCSSYLSESTLNLVSVLESENSILLPPNTPVCRVCLNEVNDREFLFADGEVVGVQCGIKEMLRLCVSNLNLHRTNTPILCKKCVEMLIMSFAFHNKYLSPVYQISSHTSTSSHIPDIGTGIYPSLTHLNQVKVKAETNYDVQCSTDISNNSGVIGVQNMYKNELFQESKGPRNIVYIKQEPGLNLTTEEVKLEDGFQQPIIADEGISGRKPYKPVTKYYFCKSCTYTTKRKACLIKHKVVHLPGYKKPIFKCEECGYTVKRKKYLDRHLALHAKGIDFKKYKCELCSFCTRKKCKLERHMTVHKDERETIMYKCSKCMFITKWKEYLGQHELKHNAIEEEKRFKCDNCSFSTNWRGSLIQHKVVHLSGEEAFKFHCTECPYKTKRRDNLTKHMIRHMKDEDVRIFYCPECPFTSKFSSKLSRHLHVHKKGDELTIHKCTECLFETRWKNNLQQHMRVHQDASQLDLFKCKECSFTTKWKTCLTEHVVMHKTGEGSKEFQCPHCNFNTKWKKSLNMHILTHTADDSIKKFKCDVCDYKTYRSHHLKRHMQVHFK